MFATRGCCNVSLHSFTNKSDPSMRINIRFPSALKNTDLSPTIMFASVWYFHICSAGFLSLHSLWAHSNISWRSRFISTICSSSSFPVNLLCHWGSINVDSLGGVVFREMQAGCVWSDTKLFYYWAGMVLFQMIWACNCTSLQPSFESCGIYSELAEVS